MKSRWNSLLVGGCNVLGLSLLALSVTAGGSAVRAAGDSASLESIALEPLTKIVAGIEQRIAALETSAAAFAHSFTVKRIAAQELCAADESGAQTCITKAQLDALLKGALQAAQAAPAAEPHQGEPAACTEKCVAPGAVAAAAPSETAATTEPPAAAVKESASAEVTAAVPPATPSAPEHQTAADHEAGPTVGVETAIPTPGLKTTETAIATTQPESPIVVELPAKLEEPANAGQASTTGSAAPEPKAVAAEETPVSERKE